MKTASDWTSTADAVELAGFSAHRIRQLIQKGKISASRKETMFWIDRTSLISYLSKPSVTASPTQSKERVFAELDSKIPHQAKGEAAGLPNPVGVAETADEAGVTVARGTVDSETEEYIRTAARMLYDIIREWRTHHGQRMADSE